MNDHRCTDCGKTHESFTASSLCCEPKRTNKRATSDSHCKQCGRFVPAGFGCHGEFLATSTEKSVKFKQRQAKLPTKREAVMAELREMRGEWRGGVRV